MLVLVPDFHQVPVPQTTRTVPRVMLNLTNLRVLLTQILSPSTLHTAVLFTPEGQLVSFVADPPRSKDEIRVIVGLGGEIWQETKDHGVGMVDSEVSNCVQWCLKPL